MKSVFSFIFLLIASSILLSQNTSNDSLVLKIPVDLEKGNYVNKIIIPFIKGSTDKQVDIKSEYWNNTIINPYKSIETKFPLKITFNDTTFISPVKKEKVITSRFGWRRGRPHTGIDIDLITGDSVVAVLDGIVRIAKYDSGLGRCVIIRHFNGLETIYGHLSKYVVKANDTIKRGQLIGKGGNTGNSRGSHLHLITSYQGNYIHPEYLFDFSDANKIRAKELWVTRKWTRAGLHSAHRKSKLSLLTSREQAIASTKKQTKIYLVKSGDTLSRIARRNNTSIASICKTNYIRRSSVLKVGQKLVLEF
ncbi:M23 family metallopeptidase [Winogradskyella immobilis]|uniref:Peptidoglycan DD-metalloendopeptidase family protein n=1 Tax=Winogradskyella immobilis TaxID=2816852 RepID=A0ABS8EPD1_9FLAO|nr:M23 family metallopeptidase [Winogradskyella immobilis]MCC1485071.1 peptidoglycan DD-metalloendopeptidase family protein [Winogradskyella immobilis]MCG0017163.1 peptidoglycan DD-metalloendopeptidase family protein [Winogradskyella immobilis]